MKQILVFAGTTEGRQLLEALGSPSATDPSQTQGQQQPKRQVQSGNRQQSGDQVQAVGQVQVQVQAYVATDYGKALLPVWPNIRVRVGRLDELQMEVLLAGQDFACVVDATHPYAAAVTANIRQACASQGVAYLRLLRQSSPESDLGTQRVGDVQEAAAYLAAHPGKALLTTGSKELEPFTAIPDFQSRLYPRILPMPQAVSHCLDLGFPPANLICMQGPFSQALNLAMLQQMDASYLVTKDGGLAGGFPEKAAAAAEAGVQLIVIRRPLAEKGWSLEEILEILEEKYQLPRQRCPAKRAEKLWPPFPLFIGLGGQKVVLFGGGSIAWRRLQALLPCGCWIQLIAPRFCQQILTLVQQIPQETQQASSGQIALQQRTYRSGDCRGAALVVAATSDRQANRQIGEECRRQGIPISVADCGQECSFYFPGILRQGTAVIGITSGGQDHPLAKQIRERIQEALPEFHGEDGKGRESNE